MAADRPSFQRAMVLMAEASAGRALRGDGATVLEHSANAALLLIDLAHGYTMHQVVAALLHDAVERELLTQEEIEEEFGENVGAHIRALTRPPDMSAEEYVAQVVRAGPRTIAVKLCDRLDALQRAAGRKQGAQQRMAETTRECYLPLAEKFEERIAEALVEALERIEG